MEACMTQERKRLILILMPLFTGIVIFLIPSVLIWTMNLGDARVRSTVDHVSHYDDPLVPVIAAIYIVKAFCYTIAFINFCISIKALLRENFRNKPGKSES